MKKIIEYRIIVGGLVFLLGLGALVAGPAAAVPENGCMVRSAYRSPVAGQPAAEVKWVFLQGSDPRRFLVRDTNNLVGARAELDFDEQGHLSGLTVARQVRGRPVVDVIITEAGNRQLILQDSLLPLDWFNCPPLPEANPAGTEMVTREKIGRAGFVRRLRLRCREMTLADAVAAGMVVDDNREFAAQKKLYLREALARENGQWVPVLRQLWTADDGFWLYEEKEGRRSWLCRRGDQP